MPTELLNFENRYIQQWIQYISCLSAQFKNTSISVIKVNQYTHINTDTCRPS